MNGSERRIEIFAPFSEALDWMKKMLFQPFDLAKWCVIGFAAFLSNFAGGIHGNFPGTNFSKWRHHDWHMRAQEYGNAHYAHAWLVPFIIVLSAAILAIVVLLMWIGARGRFIFTDCIVRNRAAIIAPWHEYRREGNSYFLFALIFLVAILAIVGVALVPAFLPQMLHGTMEGVALSVMLIFWIGLVVLLVIAWALISQLMVPVMYRRRCSASEAFSAVIALIADNFISIVLYCLFFLVLAVACGMIGCVAACVTCCIAAIPYVGTVILLPIPVTLTAFTFFFLKQFGDRFDVWAALPATESALPPGAPPPPASPPITPTEPPPLQT